MRASRHQHDATVDVVTWDLLQPGSTEITTLASVAQPWLTADNHQAKADGAEVCIYLNPYTSIHIPESMYLNLKSIYAVASQCWKSTGFMHPVTGEFVHKAQVPFIWPEAQAHCRAARFIEASTRWQSGTSWLPSSIQSN